MTKYVLAYHSGGGGMPETAEEQEELMKVWGAWFGTIGENLVDGGNPFGPATTVAADGSTSDGGTLGGYSIINAASLEEAVNTAKGCPVLASGGSLEVCEAIDM